MSRLPAVIVFLALAAAPATGDERVSTPAGQDLRHFDYLYVEANEGGSSGGHAGIRFGDDTYHFQYGDHGLLTASRADSSDYLFEYTLLQNRSVQVSRVAVDAETFAALHRAFDRDYLAQRRQLRRLEERIRTRRLLEALADGRSLRRAVPAAGYFERVPADASAGPSLAGLRSLLEDRLGEGALSARAVEAEWLGLAGGDPGPLDLARRLDEALAAREALGLLEAGARLDPVAIRSSPLPELRLDAGEVERLRLLEAAMADRLIALFQSSRPDWGVPFLTGAARWLAVRTSVERGALVFLDAFPEDALESAVDDRARGARWREAAPSGSRARRP